MPMQREQVVVAKLVGRVPGKRQPQQPQNQPVTKGWILGTAGAAAAAEAAVGRQVSRVTRNADI